MTSTEIIPIDDGRTSFLLICSVLVLFMVIPGLALYYSGAIRDKNVIASLMQTISIVCLITVVWMICGYSFTWTPIQKGEKVTNLVYGNFSRIWLLGMTVNTRHQLAPEIPEFLFCFYNLTFAIITPALICGSFADRMKYPIMCVFMILFHILVYCPIAHSIWHPQGFLFEAGALDFAGGNVVHISSGVAGLISSIVIGNRRGFGREKFRPSNILSTYMGTCFLWVGWFGFNCGSAITSGFGMEIAASAALATQIAASTAALTWMFVEWGVRKQPSVLGMVNGAVAGLVCITPACGFVDMTGAFIIGFIGGPLCYLGVQLKHWIGIDDALDAFGIHAIGGIVGEIAIGFFATEPKRGVLYSSMDVGGHQLLVQIYSILFTIAWSGIISFCLLKGLDLIFVLRVSPEHEIIGLDKSQHGESIIADNFSESSLDPPEIIFSLQESKSI